MAGERTIPQRELRNQITRVLREVGKGARFRVTVSGKPVADLVPTSGREARIFVSREAVSRILERAPLDPGFYEDIAPATSATVDEV